ncbi:MAG: hypothetical protein H0U64_06795 [Gemmatimonadaceae bacterium]|nr:hypothetical protein [Gemmatimonadaceae bacterium]
MLLLASTSDLLRVVSGSAVTTDVHASWADLNGSTVAPGRTNTPITTATTTTVVASPAASTYRTVKTLTVRNRHASSSQDVTIVHTDGTNAMELVKVTLSAGDALHYDENNGFTVRDSYGRIKSRSDGLVAAVVNSMNTVVLTADVTNSNATLNTIADVTGLSFAVTAGETYQFEFTIAYTAAATTTGSRWAINGPGSPTALSYYSTYVLTAASLTSNFAATYDQPAAANASSLTTGNVALIIGTITPSASGTVIARFASEVASSAIVAKAGSLLKWIRTL